MKIKKTHCLFEQTGTFKKAFEKLGIPAQDYDISNDYNETNYKTDIFMEITSQPHSQSSIFNKFNSDDLVMAFFPCTYFSDQQQLNSRGDNISMKGWTAVEKLENSIKISKYREDYYRLLCQLCLIAFERNFPLIVENPLGRVGFLKQYFPIKSGIKIMDRRVYGDFFKKPTVFYFINCVANYNLSQEHQVKGKIPRIVDCSGFDRSIISPAFAENFIKTFIL